MTRSLCNLILGLVLLGTCAVDSPPASAQADPGLPLQAGAWALQFDVNENFTLGSHLGSTISVKRHTSAARAWQLGLSVTAAFEASDDARASTNSDNESIGVVARYLIYPLMAEPGTQAVQLFFGIGPQFGFRRNSQSVETENQDRDGTTLTWRAGVAGTVGTEWFVHPRIGLHAAYNAALAYKRRSYDREIGKQDPQETTSSRVDVGGRGVSFGASVYF